MEGVGVSETPSVRRCCRGFPPVRPLLGWAEWGEGPVGGEGGVGFLGDPDLSRPVSGRRSERQEAAEAERRGA